MKLRIAFDLDETLGVPLIEGSEMVGFKIREGGVELLERLAQKHCLILWTVASRRYIEKVLSFGLENILSRSVPGMRLPPTGRTSERFALTFSSMTARTISSGLVNMAWNKGTY